MLRRILLLLSMCLLAPACATGEITVSAAASMKEVITEIAAGFENEQATRVRLNFGASGRLAEQIKGGAPVDVFISAAAMQVEDLQRQGLIDKDAVRVIAGNALVLVVPAGARTVIDSFESLATASVDRIAIGNPESVPAGFYAREVFQSLRLESALQGRLMYGTNVRQVLDYVERSEVDAGVVFRTDALQSPGRVRIVAIADAKHHSAIVYPAAVLRDAVSGAEAAAFIEYLGSEPARAVLARHGFSPAPEPAAAGE